MALTLDLLLFCYFAWKFDFSLKCGSPSTDTPCVPWSDVIDEDLTADEFPDRAIPYNACRDVTDRDYAEDAPWCYTSVEGVAEVCDVQECDE